MKYTKFPDDNWGIRVNSNTNEAREACKFIQKLVPSPDKGWNGSGSCYYIKNGKLDCVTAPSGIVVFTYEEFRETLEFLNRPKDQTINNYSIY